MQPVTTFPLNTMHRRIKRRRIIDFPLASTEMIGQLIQDIVQHIPMRIWLTNHLGKLIWCNWEMEEGEAVPSGEDVHVCRCSSGILYFAPSEEMAPEREQPSKSPPLSTTPSESEFLRQRAALNGLEDPVFLTDGQRVVYANRALYAAVGQEAWPLTVSSVLRALFAPGQVEELRALHLPQALKGASYCAEHLVKQRIGEPKQGIVRIAKSGENLATVQISQPAPYQTKLRQLKQQDQLFSHFLELDQRIVWEVNAKSFEILSTMGHCPKKGPMAGLTHLQIFSKIPDVQMYMERALLKNQPQQWVHSQGGHSFEFMTMPIYSQTRQTELLLVLCVDVSESETLRSNIRHASARLSAILSNMPCLVWAADPNLNMIFLEGHMAGRLAIDIASGVGRPLSQVLGGIDSLELRAREVLETGRSVYHTHSFRGVVFKSDISLLRDAHGRPEAILGVMTDISENAALTNELIKTKERAEVASRAKTEFISRMSHEIRTPITAVMGMIDIARSTRDPGRIAECLNNIDVSSRHLMSVINDILDISRIESGRLELNCHPFDLEHQLEEVLSINRVQADSKCHKMEVWFDPHLPRYWMGDSMRICQILSNLLSNAIKFTLPEGVISLNMRYGGMEEGRTRIVTSVKDNGIGISRPEVDRIFRAFEQANGGSARAHGGSGLGLAICKKLVAAMGGSILVDSEPGKGSEFIFDIWLTPAPPMESAPRKRLPGGVLFISVFSKTREYALDIFTTNGYHMDEASSPDKALRRLTHNPKRYAAVVVDIDGQAREDVEEIAALAAQNCPDARLLLIGTRPCPKTSFLFHKMTEYPFLQKPLLPSTLLDALESDTPPQSRKHAEEEQVQPPDLTGKCILVVEDAEMNLEIVRFMLESTNADLVIARDGECGVAAYAAQPEKIDMILMDVQMPILDGMEATRRIRQSGLPGCKTVPILAMTASVLSNSVEQAQEAGMNGHIGKPFAKSQLYSALSSYLGASPKVGGNDREEQYTSSEDGLPEMLPGISIARALERLRIPPQRYRELVEQQLSGIRLEMFRSAADNSDLKALRILAHSLKGGAAMLGLDSITAQASALEAAAAEQREIGQVMALIDELEEASAFTRAQWYGEDEEDELPTAACGGGREAARQ